MREYPGTQRVDAAKHGDQQALDELIAAYLPLVYNIVGRALDGHADVDDVVQETMLRVVHGIAGLRDPAAFRSWVVAIAVRETRDRRRLRRTAGDGGMDELLGIADPGADFVDLTILRLGLSGQRRETAEASRWLEAADRDLLALWWLETAGQITRSDLAGAMEQSTEHVAVRVQRMKAQLETARAVVRALWAAPRCPRLDEAIRDWDGNASSLWRKRLARHVRECPACSAHLEGLVPAERLLAGIALVPLTGVLTGIAAHPALLAALWSSADPHAEPAAAARVARHTATRRTPRSTWARNGRLLTAKSVVVPVALTAVVGGAAVALTGRSAPASPVAVVRAQQATNRPVLPPSASAGSPSTSTAESRPPKASASASPSSTAPTTASPTTATPTAAVYGQTVDTPDSAPPKNLKPGALPHRPETKAINVIAGKWNKPFTGAIGGSWLMFYRGDSETLSGTGYFSVRWEVAYFNRVGRLVMPTWTGLRGKLFHVASGGYYRMTDERPNATDQPHTWMGQPSTGYDTLPSGAQQMWEVEFFHLDGTVTLHLNENYADYNLGVSPETWQSVTTDIDTPPDPATYDDPSNPRIRYGIVRDTGNDAAPVPQYLTRSDPSDPTGVPQHSHV
ncbi:RNA polymerase sigma factor [Streptacidiphilus sp. EB103A]|uniref:RNA polymerase sigma factor n=1 Tax=Streptacidiphilus sp. EB103A TaxID=3156275 RepID=UPI0035163EA7